MLGLPGLNDDSLCVILHTNLVVENLRSSFPITRLRFLLLSFMLAFDEYRNVLFEVVLLSSCSYFLNLNAFPLESAWCFDRVVSAQMRCAQCSVPPTEQDERQLLAGDLLCRPVLTMTNLLVLFSRVFYLNLQVCKIVLDALSPQYLHACCCVHAV